MIKSLHIRYRLRRQAKVSPTVIVSLLRPLLGPLSLLSLLRMIWYIRAAGIAQALFRCRSSANSNDSQFAQGRESIWTMRSRVEELSSDNLSCNHPYNKSARVNGK